jgi:prephenate dehydratase
MDPARDAAVVTYSGSPGAYAHVAATRLCPGAACVPVRGFEAVVASVHTGHARFGVIPCENAYAGPVSTAVAALLANPVAVAAEIWMPVPHLLLALPGVQLNEVTEVASHPEAIRQCDRFVMSLGLAPVACTSTATAAEELLARGPRHRAVIAGPEAARRYGLSVVAENIATASDNRTRFWLLAKDAPPAACPGAQTWTLMAKPDRSAWWRTPPQSVHVLGARGDVWLLDAHAPEDLSALQRHSLEPLRVLGSYPTTAPPLSRAEPP